MSDNCVACGNEISDSGSQLCWRCRQDLIESDTPASGNCDICGKPLAIDNTETICDECKKVPACVICGIEMKEGRVMCKTCKDIVKDRDEETSAEALKRLTGMSILETYQRSVVRSQNKSLNVEEKLQEGLMGIAGESGEALEHIKKYLFQGHSLDIIKLADELGDVLWYLTQTAMALGYDLDDIIRINMDKTHKRYPDGFNTRSSMNRKDLVNETQEKTSCHRGHYL